MDQQRTLNLRGKIVSLDTPLVMGVINVNEDSFYKASRHTERDSIMGAIEIMVADGVDIVDIGAMSSRPGANISLAEEEIFRLKPIVRDIVARFPDLKISIDTLHSTVAQTLLDEGVAMINDISAGCYDSEMLDVVARHQAAFVMMHMAGLPATMQDHPKYADVTAELLAFFVQRIKAAQDAGIRDIVLDPGFGFGKTMAHNFQLVRDFDNFLLFDLPLLAGVSRKSMIWKTLGIQADEALNGSTALHMILLQKGAQILRVHDVKAAKECITLMKAIQVKDETFQNK